MSPEDYLEQLTAALAARGIAGEQAEEVLREARAHLADSTEDPEAALGAPEAWASALAARGGQDGAFEERTLTGVTAFTELPQLEAAGAEGWSLVGCGPLQLHLRRPADGPHPPVEHLRVVGSAQRDRELVAEGWELATTWLVFRYYRRPAS